MDWVTVRSSAFALIGAAMLVAAGREFVRCSAAASGMIVALTEDRERDEIS